MLHGKNLQPFTGAVFVNSLQVLDSPQENLFTYGESVSASFNLRYPGQYFDKESGLNYNYFRSYDSRTGRYSQSDPIDLAGGWNKFGYAEFDPLTYTDPLGLYSWSEFQSDAFDAAVGFGDGVSFGGTAAFRKWSDIDGGVDKCTASYKAGDFAGSMIGPLGRFGYIGSVGKLTTKVPQTATQAAALSAERNAIKRYYRGPFADFIPDYKTAAWAEARFARQEGAAFANSAGKSNYGFNALAGFGAINATSKAINNDGCTCK